MQAYRHVPAVLGVFLAILIGSAALGGERAIDYDKFLKEVVEEMRIIRQHEALLKKRMPKPSPSRAQLLLDQELMKDGFRQAASSRKKPARKAPEPRADVEKAARELLAKERRRAAEVQSARVKRLIKSAQGHDKRGRSRAAAKALRSVLKIDPRNKRAIGMLKKLEASAAAADEAKTRRSIDRETAASLRYIDRIRTPQAALLTVPKGWAERQAQKENLLARKAASPDAAAEAAVRKALAAKISIDATQTPLGDVVAYLREAGKINIVLEPAAANEPVDLHLENMSVESVLGWVTKLTGQSYAVREGVVHIGPKEKIAAGAVIRVYDVSDILRVRQLLRKGRAKRDDVFDEPVKSVRELADDLMDFIKHVTGPEHWGEDEGKSKMNFQLGRLVVNAEPSVQLKVLEVISKIRD